MCRVGGVFLLQKIIINKSNIIKFTVKFLSVSLLCFFICSILFCLTAAIVSKLNFSYEILYPVIAIILAVSAFLNGFIISRWYKENGLIYGILAGFTILIILIIFSLKYSLFSLSSHFLTKTITVIVSGAIGGIIGVNTN